MRFWQRILLSAALSGAANPVMAAELAGVDLPSTETSEGTTLTLNGIGLRTYSVLGVHIYVAGLYLQKPSHNADAILDSSDSKMLILHFVHDVPAAKMRDAWRKELVENCVSPCTLSSTLLDHFLSSLTDMHAGETVALAFSGAGMSAYYDGKPAGNINDPEFAKLMLTSFLGPNSATPTLRDALLGIGENMTVRTQTAAN